MAGKVRSAFHKLNIEDIDIQPAPGCDLGVQLPKGSCRGISGIGKQWLSFLFLALVKLFKALFGHEHFTAYNQPCRRIFQGHRNGFDGFQVFCYIFTNIAVATGGTPGKNSIDIFQRNRQSIHLRFHGKLGIRLQITGFIQEFRQFFHTENVLKAHQRYRMGHLFKLAQRFTAYTPGGRILPDEFRMGLLQILQFSEKLIVFKIMHLGIIQHIIPIICFFQQIDQFINSLFGIHFLLRLRLFVKMY